jgi:hypothetical protein
MFPSIKSSTSNIELRPVPLGSKNGNMGIQSVDDQSSNPSQKYISLRSGELTFEEDTSGGLGRHLGVFSTTFLMQASLNPQYLTILQQLTIVQSWTHHWLWNFLDTSKHH